MAAKKEYQDERWSEYASSYKTVSDFSQIGAGALVDLTHSIAPYSASSSKVLDSGSGTGVTPSILVQRFPSISILAADVSPGMVAAIEAKKLPNVSARVLDATKKSDLEDGEFSHVLSTFMIQFLPNPDGVVAEMVRVLRPGGVLGLGIWDKNNDPIIAWAKACTAIDPGYRVPKAHDESAWYSVDEMEAALTKVGLKDVRSDVVRTRFGHDSAESYVNFWFNGKNPAAESLLNAWTGDIAEVRREMLKIIKEDYDDGRGVFISMGLTAGRK